MGERKLKPGTEVIVTYRAKVGKEEVEGFVNLVRAWNDGGVINNWFEPDNGNVTIEISPPLNWTPGTILSANGQLWLVRKSAKHVSYRVQPVDLSTRNRTLPIEDFYARYPDAKIQFDPSGVKTRAQTKGEPVLEWERELLRGGKLTIGEATEVGEQ